MLLNVDTSTKKLHTLHILNMLHISSRKIHVNTFMRSPCDPIYQGVTLM